MCVCSSSKEYICFDPEHYLKELLDYNIGGLVKKKIECIEQNLQNLLCIKIIRTFIILVCKRSYKCLWSTLGNSPSLLLFCLLFFFQCSTTVAQIKAVCISCCTWPLFLTDWKCLMTPETTKIWRHICSCHNFFPLSSVQSLLIPACCLLCLF